MCIRDRARTHQLIDENGDEISDLGQIKFAAPIVTEFQKLIDKITELIDKLTKGLVPALTNIPAPTIPEPDFPHRVEPQAVSYTHLRAHETPEHLVCRLLLEKKK